MLDLACIFQLLCENGHLFESQTIRYLIKACGLLLENKVSWILAKKGTH